MRSARVVVGAMAVFALAAPAVSRAQAAPAAAVEAVNEPHHHLAYSDAHMRVLHVEVPAHDSTLLHAHQVDYFWLARGPSEIVNAVEGKARTRATVADGSLHFARGGFAHVAIVPTSLPFHNITVELLDPQLDVRNLCEAVLPEEPVNCPAVSGRYTGATVRPAFETDRWRITFVQVAPGATLAVDGSRSPPLLIPAEATSPGVTLSCESGGTALATPLRVRAGEAFRLSAFATCRVANGGSKVVRLIAVDSVGPRR